MKKRKLTDNLSLKIMSVAIAIVVWLIVVNIDNPVGTNYYTITDVELINKEYVNLQIPSVKCVCRKKIRIL